MLRPDAAWNIGGGLVQTNKVGYRDFSRAMVPHQNQR